MNTIIRPSILSWSWHRRLDDSSGAVVFQVKMLSRFRLICMSIPFALIHTLPLLRLYLRWFHCPVILSTMTTNRLNPLRWSTCMLFFHRNLIVKIYNQQWIKKWREKITPKWDVKDWNTYHHLYSMASVGNAMWSSEACVRLCLLYQCDLWS